MNDNRFIGLQRLRALQAQIERWEQQLQCADLPPAERWPLIVANSHARAEAGTLKMLLAAVS